MRVALAATGLMAVLLTVTGNVQSAEEPNEVWLMAKYDGDGDRMISATEVSAKRQKMFAHMDGDGDGLVSFAEYQNLDTRKRELLLAARFHKLDSDRDGRLSTKEYGSYYGAFEQMDSNGDGRITESEMLTAAPSHETQQHAAVEDTHCLLWFCVKTTLD